MTIEQIMKLDAEDIANMSDSEIRAATRRLVDAANKRMKRAEQRGQTYTPAYQGNTKSGGKFKTQRGLDRAQLINEFKRARAFLQSKTSTAKGAKEWKKNVEKATGLTFDDKEGFDILTKAGNLLSDLMNYNSAFAAYDSTILREAIRKILEKESKDGEPDYTSIIKKFDDMQNKIIECGIEANDMNSVRKWVSMYNNT